MLKVLRTAIIVLTALSSAAGAQTQRNARRFLPELRMDAAESEGIDYYHVAGGFHVNSGTYMRLAMLAGYGLSRTKEESAPSYRLELQGRFHLDPARASRYGLYGIGGIATSRDDFADWQTKIVAGAGVELPAHGRATLAIEVALAGGFRISVLTRRLTLGRR